MNYDIFKEALIEGIKERIGETAEVSLKEITKNNGVVLDGLLITRKDSLVAPTFYVNNFYEMYEKEKNFDSIVDMLFESYEKNSIDIDFNPKTFEEFEQIKDSIMFKLINKKMNKDVLDTIPHRDFLDLVICYYVLVKDSNFDNGSILINNSHMNMWGVDEQVLFEISKINTAYNFESDLLSMYDMMCELMTKRGENEDIIHDMLKPMDDKMYVLTNKNRHFGASCIIYKDVLKDFSEQKNSNLVIIPSSVHEVIVLAQEDDDSIEDLNEMVNEVNRNHVLPQEILSDHIYIYDRKEARIKMS